VCEFDNFLNKIQAQNLATLSTLYRFMIQFQRQLVAE